MLQGACLGGSVQRIRAQCIVLLHGSFARALGSACRTRRLHASRPQMNESAHALRWRAPAHCARRLRRVRCSFLAECCTCGVKECLFVFVCVVYPAAAQRTHSASDQRQRACNGEAQRPAPARTGAGAAPLLKVTLEQTKKPHTISRHSRGSHWGRAVCVEYARAVRGYKYK